MEQIRKQEVINQKNQTMKIQRNSKKIADLYDKIYAKQREFNTKEREL